jgi:hypothetical protein
MCVLCILKTQLLVKHASFVKSTRDKKIGPSEHLFKNHDKILLSSQHHQVVRLARFARDKNAAGVLAVLTTHTAATLWTSSTMLRMTAGPSSQSLYHCDSSRKLTTAPQSTSWTVFDLCCGLRCSNGVRRHFCHPLQASAVLLP